MNLRVQPLGLRMRSVALFLALAAVQILLVLNILSVDPSDSMSLLVVVMLAGLLFIVPLVTAPDIGVLLVPLLLIIPAWFVGFTLSEVVLLGALLFVCLRSLASGERIEAPWAVEFVFALYVAWTALSVFQAVEVKSAIIGFKGIVMHFVAFLAGLHVLGKRRARNLVHVVSLLGTLIALQLTAVVLLNGYSFSMLVTRVGALTDLLWGYSVYVAAVAAVTISASVPLAFYGRPWERVLGISGLASAVFVSIATLSRGGTLAIAVALLLATALEIRRRFLLAVLILGVLGSAYAFSSLGQATLERFVKPQALTSVAARLVFYQDTFRVAKENPLLGVGPNQIPFNSPILMGPNPHNFLLKNAADHGLPGLALYLLVLGMVALRIRRLYRANTREARFFGLSLVLLLAVGLTNALYEPTLEGWVFGCVFWMMAGTLYRRAEETPTSPMPDA